jgi:hypothetical protein
MKGLQAQELFLTALSAQRSFTLGTGYTPQLSDGHMTDQAPSPLGKTAGVDIWFHFCFFSNCRIIFF